MVWIPSNPNMILIKKEGYNECANSTVACIDSSDLIVFLGDRNSKEMLWSSQIVLMVWLLNSGCESRVPCLRGNNRIYTAALWEQSLKVLSPHLSYDVGARFQALLYRESLLEDARRTQRREDWMKSSEIAKVSITFCIRRRFQEPFKFFGKIVL